jgi:hypothetical protein
VWLLKRRRTPRGLLDGVAGRWPVLECAEWQGKFGRGIAEFGFWAYTVSIEAFIWNYRNGEPIGFPFDAVRDILFPADSDWNSEYGCLTIRFRNPDDYVDVYVNKDAPITNHIGGIMVSRPIAHPEYLSRVLRLMRLGHVVLFYSDETTPVFVRGADPNHYPSDLLEQLGTPRFVDSPGELRHQT